MLRLNLGVGPQRYEGYVGLDINSSHPGVDVVADLYEPLPFADESVDEILCVHTLEHLLQWRVPHVLAEWFRVLTPDGFAWGVVPDAYAHAKAYVAAYEAKLRPDDPRLRRNLDALLGGARSDEYSGPFQQHGAAFDEESLRLAFYQGGFWQVVTNCQAEAQDNYVIHFAAVKRPPPTAAYPYKLCVEWKVASRADLA